MTDHDAAPTDSPRTGTDGPVNEVRTIVFRVTPWRALDGWRDIELREDQTLHAFHEGIQDAFELDRDHFYAFYLNGHAFDRMHNYEGPESAVTERRALDTRLGHLPLRENKRFLYLFDFGDELRHDVRVVGHSASESGVSYPRLVGAEGEVVGRIDEACQFTVLPEVREALEELIPDLRMCVTRSEQRWLDGEEEPKPSEAADVRRTLAAEYELAKVLLERAACDFKVIHLVLEDPLEQNVWGWLAELPEALSRAELHEPAIELTKTLLAVAPESSLRAQLPLFLLQAGYGEQAIEAIERELAEDPDNPLLLHAAAQTHQTLGDTERAIAHYTEALTWVGSERDLRNDIVQGLVHLLDSTGQSAAGIRLLQHEQEVEQSWLAPWERRSVPIRREQPKTGRNDPCPCGSNKKYKKCCGR